jgi:antitoxin component YwqK of YwqJK toxin-antitoxin module
MSKYSFFIFFFIMSVLSYAQTQTDASGKKQGYWKKMDDKTKKLIYEGMFKDDKPQGKFKYYYPFDSIKAIMDFKQDGKFAYSTMFHPNGKKMAFGKYIGENKDSVWTYFDDQVTLISRESYLNGQKNGMEYVYFPDGVVSEERKYKMGKMDGPFKLYYDKNLLKSEGVYINGQLEGRNAFYYPDGITAAVGYYKNGKKTGPWIYRDKKGKVTEKELYKPTGELATKKETDEFFNKNKAVDEKPKTVDTKTTSTKPKSKTTTAKPKVTK